MLAHGCIGQHGLKYFKNIRSDSVTRIHYFRFFNINYRLQCRQHIWNRRTAGFQPQIHLFRRPCFRCQRIIPIRNQHFIPVSARRNSCKNLRMNYSSFYHGLPLILTQHTQCSAGMAAKILLNIPILFHLQGNGKGLQSEDLCGNRVSWSPIHRTTLAAHSGKQKCIAVFHQPAGCVAGNTNYLTTAVSHRNDRSFEFLRLSGVGQRNNHVTSSQLPTRTVNRFRTMEIIGRISGG